MADDTDFDAISKSTGLDTWADEHVAILRAMGAWNRAKMVTGVEPDDHLIAIELGDASSHNVMRLAYQTGAFVVQQRTGTEQVPVYSGNEKFQLTVATGAIALQGTLSTNGNDIQMGGGNLVGPTFVDGIDIQKHEARHLPSGADSLATAAAANIGISNTEGVAESFARSDHQHQGVYGFQANLGTVTHGTINFEDPSPGDLTFTLSGSDLEADLTADAKLDLRPPRSWTQKTSDQTMGSDATEEDITTLTGISFPSTPGAATKYEIEAFFSLETDAAGIAWGEIKLYTGATGDMGDTLKATWRQRLDGTSPGDFSTLSTGPFEVTPGTGNTKFGFSVNASSTDKTTVKGSAVGGRSSYVRVVELRE